MKSTKVVQMLLVLGLLVLVACSPNPAPAAAPLLVSSTVQIAGEGANLLDGVLTEFGKLTVVSRLEGKTRDSRLKSCASYLDGANLNGWFLGDIDPKKRDGTAYRTALGQMVVRGTRLYLRQAVTTWESYEKPTARLIEGTVIVSRDFMEDFHLGDWLGYVELTEGTLELMVTKSNGSGHGVIFWVDRDC